MNSKKLNTDTEFFMESGSFQPLMFRVREEISHYRLTISPTVTLSRDLTQKLLTKDNPSNRITVLSYLLTRALGYATPEELSLVICSSVLCHIGLTQIAPQTYDNEEIYQQHPLLSSSLLMKFADHHHIDPRMMRIINEHHERIDGRGFPHGLTQEKIDPLSLILGSVSQIIEYSEGYREGENKNKIPLNKLFLDLHHNNQNQQQKLQLPQTKEESPSQQEAQFFQNLREGYSNLLIERLINLFV